MRLAVSNIAWSPDERIEAYRILQDAGISGLEIAPGLFFHAASDPFVPAPNDARQALVEIEDAGLSLVSMQSLLFGVEGAGLFDGPFARRAFESGMLRAIDLAGRFGIPNCVFGSPAQRRVPDDMPMERALAEAAEVFVRLGERARQAGTKIAIEANPARYGTNFLTTLEEAAAFVKRVDHPSVVPILDLGAMHINCVFNAAPDYIPSLMPALNHVHVSEPDLGPAPGEETDLTPVLRRLRAEGYVRWVSIEMKQPEGGLAEVKAAVARLTRAIAEPEAANA
jgi:sugar phosphate isomerase/epimerase